jgi:hypothetical protein
MVSTEANSILGYQSALVATSSLAVLSAEEYLEQVGQWTKEMKIYSIRPRDSSRDF